MERDVRKALKKHLKGATASTIEVLARRIGILPADRVLLTTDIGIALASVSLRAAIEFLRAAPEVAHLVESSDMRVWGEVGRRISATSGDAGAEFFQISAKVLEATDAQMRPIVLKLASKQAALSANTAVRCFKSSPEIINQIGDPTIASEVLNICLELARHSVKHSYDLLMAAPAVIAQLRRASGHQGNDFLRRALSLTSSFAFKSGGTAAEFFAELTQIGAVADSIGDWPESLEQLFANTEGYLERSGGVALEYFKAASRVLAIAGSAGFSKWTALAKRVAVQGNAASYHFMKASPRIISELASRAGAHRRAQLIASVLEVVEQIGQKNPAAAIECFKASPLALSAASVGQFRQWALGGLEHDCDDPRRTQAYYSLESKKSQEALMRIEGGLTLDSVQLTLRLYVEGLTGRSIGIAPLSSIPDEAKIGDGKTIYLPSVVTEFETERDNFRLFKVLAAHAAGQIEFKTRAVDTPEIIAALAEVRSAFADQKAQEQPNQPQGISFANVLAEFPNTDLAMRLFTTVENGRIDYLLRKAYRGIRRDLDFVRARLARRRPKIKQLPPEIAPFELLFQIAICGGATQEARQVYPSLVRQLEQIFEKYVERPDASVADSLMATLNIYELFIAWSAACDAYSEQTALDEQSDGGNQADGSSNQATVADPNAQIQRQVQPIEVRDDPLSFWSANIARDLTVDNELLGRVLGGESAEQDLEEGDRVFYYDEWDRELGDYRTRWCRVIEREGARGSRSFVEMVRNRYAGIISSVRYQFQLLKPEDLRRVRGEVDGEDYDLQAVIDYALDKRSTGLIDDRLYTRKLRRQRDVAVSFLLDMSSSTARTITRDRRRPYTQPGRRIIDIEKEGLVLMSEALEAVGDVYSMQGFTSEGRRNVKFYIIKDFDEIYSADIERRIGGITYQNNTRLGAAIRHAAIRLMQQEARTRLLIVLSDGRPYDHDYGDSRYAREDTMMALRQARLLGITPFCITIDRESENQLRDMYGEVGYTIIDDVLSLPERLPGIYTRLTT
jgi:nitric oxide reductase NorD protein